MAESAWMQQGSEGASMTAAKIFGLLSALLSVGGTLLLFFGGFAYGLGLLMLSFVLAGVSVAVWLIAYIRALCEFADA
jgi:hypothetical protein